MKYYKDFLKNQIDIKRVTTERFYGTCYKAANWKYLGDTTGRGGKDEKSQRQTRSIKAVWEYCFCYSYDMLLHAS